MQKSYTQNKRGFISLIALVLLISSIASSAMAFVPFDKVTYANADPNKYSIELDLTNKITTIYEQNKDGKHTKIAKQFIITTGNDATPTPEGTFRLNDSRRRFGYFSKYKVYGQYWTHVIGGIYFHSILYTERKEGKFTKTSYNALGSQASHGCIRMLVEDARWLYYNCPGGTIIKIISKKKDEALRKSLLPKISASKYYPSADEYESVKRGYPKALLKTDAYFVSTKGATYLVEKGKDVDVISSGKQSCRVRVDGVEGHIETKYLDFLPNGPKNQKNIKTLIDSAKTHYEVKSKEANLYERANATSGVVGVFGKGTDLLISGETKSYYIVEIDSEVGYILKTDTKQAKGPIGSKPNVVKIELETVNVDIETEDEGEVEVISPEENESGEDDVLVIY